MARSPRTPKNMGVRARQASHEAQLVAIDTLKPYPGNARVHDLPRIRESLRINTQYRPIVVRTKTRHVLAGNGTLEAAVAEGWSEVWATFIDCDAKAAERINQVDNRLNDLAGWDDQLLAKQLGKFPALEGTGWSEREMVSFVARVNGPGEDTEPIEPPKVPRTKLGDLWVLGEHRLLCGDALDAEALDQVYIGAVGCVLTDPPYGIDLDTDYSRKSKRVDGNAYRRVAGDDAAFDAAPVVDHFGEVKEQFWFGANYYRRTLSGDDRDGSWLVWDKRNAESDDVLGSGFELIWSRTAHQQRMIRRIWHGFTARNGDGPRVHPNEKPVALLDEILDRWAPEGCVVADPFAGSGSTLVACENLSRRCYAMEIDPGYCDVIIDRWERHTGKKATRART